MKAAAGMKGEFSNALIFFMIFFAGVYTLSVILNLQAYQSHNQKIVLETEEFSLEKALEAAKLYAETSLRYSFYQACYNVSLNGGWQPDGSAPSGKNAAADAATFKKALENETLRILGAYAGGGYSFLGSFDVFVPAYGSVAVTDMGDGVVNVTAASDKMLSIHRELDTKNVTLYKNADLSVNITSPCFTLQKKALERSVSIASADSVRSELDRWPIEASVELGHAFTKDHNDAFYSAMMADYPELIRGQFREATALKDGEAMLASAVSAPIGSQKLSVKVAIAPSCTGYTFVEDGAEKSKKDCEFSYSVAIASSSTMAEESAERYPVFNGTDVAFEPVKFVFSYGKVYERKPAAKKTG